MTDVKITGTEEFVRVAKAFNQMGSAGRGLKRELMSEIKTAAEPMADQVRDHIAQYLPGRYAAVLASDLQVRPSQKTAGAAVGLKLVGHAKGRRRRRAVRTIDRGTLRHPVYGRAPWVDQSVRPGFWSTELPKAREKAAKPIRRAVQRAADQIRKAG